MKRTRKWQFVAQEATRLAKLGLSPKEIAKKIDVRRSTVQRWMAAGRILDTRQGARSARAKRLLPRTSKIKPSMWASKVRREYQLDATDDVLVTLGDKMLTIANDPNESASVKATATARFQSIAKQLALVARQADAAPELEPRPSPPEQAAPRRTPEREVRRPAVDPRKILMAVK